MGSSTVIVTGGDAGFFPFIVQAVESLFALGLTDDAAIAVLDQGLLPEQVQQLRARGCQIARATWTLDVPDELRSSTQIGLIARTSLRDYFPGFDVYVWFDADAWAQTREFFDRMTTGARRYGAALVREDGRGYRRHVHYTRWWYGHMMLLCGPWTGLRIARKPSINIGVMALAADAPHWQRWRELYERFIARNRRVNLDQHAFNAAVELHQLPYARLPSRCNWIPRLSAPVWNARDALLHEPAGEPLSVVHLAGPDKRAQYKLRCAGGQSIATALTYDALRNLRMRPRAAGAGLRDTRLAAATTELRAAERGAFK